MGERGVFGPLTVHPDSGARGVGQKLLPPALGLFEAWGCRHTGLYTYSGSPKHLGLYQKFGFWPRALTAIMAKPVRPVERVGEVSLYSQAPAPARPGLVAAAAGLTDAIYAGLDVGREIFVLAAQGLGDTVFIWDDPGLVGFGAVRLGPGSEAGSGSGFIKFGAARPGPKAGNISTGSSPPARPTPRPRARPAPHRRGQPGPKTRLRADAGPGLSARGRGRVYAQTQRTWLPPGGGVCY